jgi:S1-C subfamily serine protease
MTEKQDYWQEVTPKQRDLLDLELIEQLNEQYLSADDFSWEYTENTEYTTIPGQRKNGIKLIGFVTVLIFTAFILANWLQLFRLPSMDFIGKSLELAKNQEIKDLQQAVVAVNLPGRQGTGFNIDRNGLIITNYHVVKDGSTIEVVFSQGQIFAGKIIHVLPEIDLAIINIQGENLPFVELEDASFLKTGEQVLIIGNPLGFSRVIKEGEIIGEHLLRGWDEPVLMIRGPIYSGSSGSPVFNEAGRVVAIIFASLTIQRENEPDELIGLAVPINKLAEQL